MLLRTVLFENFKGYDNVILRLVHVRYETCRSINFVISL